MLALIKANGRCDLAQTVGPRGHVFCFEPSPEYSGCLLTAINRLDVRNVTRLPIAVSDTPERVGYLTHDIAGHRLCGESRLVSEPASAEHVVDVASLDTLSMAFPLIAAADFIKFDIEGAEFNAIRGAQISFSEEDPFFMLK